MSLAAPLPLQSLSPCWSPPPSLPLFASCPLPVFLSSFTPSLPFLCWSPFASISLTGVVSLALLTYSLRGLTLLYGVGVGGGGAEGWWLGWEDKDGERKRKEWGMWWDNGVKRKRWEGMGKEEGEGRHGMDGKRERGRKDRRWIIGKGKCWLVKYVFV